MSRSGHWEQREEKPDENETGVGAGPGERCGPRQSFYADQVGFQADLDVRPNEAVRIVQLTPPESACSIVIGTGLPDLAMPPGSLRGLHLVVGDVRAAREALISRGVEVSEVEEHAQGVKYAYFSDPDGNNWALQEMPWRS